MGFSQLLVSNFQTLQEEKIKNYLNSINKSAINGNDLLENLLQWSRVQTGRMTFEPVKQNLLEISEKVIGLFEGNSQQKGITFTCNITSDIDVFADENMLNTILRNLISNAIKFTSDNGQIALKAKLLTDSPYVEISVSDTGIGMNESTINSLFDVNNTFSSKGTANETGTGLGLIICKEFVEKHNGKIWVQSEEGKGSVFSFLIPVYI